MSAVPVICLAPVSMPLRVLPVPLCGVLRYGECIVSALINKVKHYFEHTHIFCEQQKKNPPKRVLFWILWITL